MTSVRDRDGPVVLGRRAVRRTQRRRRHAV